MSGPVSLRAYRACAARGLSLAETAHELGVAVRTVYAAAKRYGLCFDGYNENNTAEAYRACAARGLTAAETARELGVNVSAVYRATARHGLSFTRARPGPAPTSPERLAIPAGPITMVDLAARENAAMRRACGVGG